MSRPFLTVLTTPIPSTATRWVQRARRALRPLLKPGVPLPAVSPYPGHYAVTRSVVEGLRAIRADFNFDPRTLGALARVVYAPANEALRQAIALKQQGRIDYLVAGPVNALLPGDADGILLAPEIDRAIIACDWAVDLYRSEPRLVAKSRVCPVGVDAEYWKPSGARSDTRAVIYWKNGDDAFCGQVERSLRAFGLEPVRVRTRHGEHGHFDRGQFRQFLDGAVLAVFLSSFETQGLALAEAWSMNVPTVVWNPCGMAEWQGRSFRSGSSCPYLTASTGTTFLTLDDLDRALGETLAQRDRFTPRAWVLEHMTDAIRSAALLTLVRAGVEKRDV